MRVGAIPERDAYPTPRAEIGRMTRRRESAFDGAIECKVRTRLNLGREFLSGNVRVTATPKNDNVHMVDIGKVLEIDVPSGKSGHVQA